MTSRPKGWPKHGYLLGAQRMGRWGLNLRTRVPSCIQGTSRFIIKLGVGRRDAAARGHRLALQGPLCPGAQSEKSKFEPGLRFVIQVGEWNIFYLFNS